MIYLIGEMLLLLLIAAAIGFAAAWVLRGLGQSRAMGEAAAALWSQRLSAAEAEYEAKANSILGAAETRKASLEGAAITLKANASPEGKLFGSVGPRDIAEAFSAAGHPLEKSEVIMSEGPIRHTGEFEVHVHLHADVHTTVKVTVTSEE